MLSVAMELLLLFGPPMISCLLYSKLRKESFQMLDFVMWLFAFASIIHVFSLTVMLLMGGGTKLIADLFQHVSGTAKYGLLSLTAAVAIPNIIRLLSTFEKRNKS